MPKKATEPVVEAQKATQYRLVVCGGKSCEWRDTPDGVEVLYEGETKLFPSHERFQEWLSN